MTRLRLDYSGFAVKARFSLGGYGIGVLRWCYRRALTMRPVFTHRSCRRRCAVDQSDWHAVREDDLAPGGDASVRCRTGG